MSEFEFCKFNFNENINKVIWEVTNQCNYSCHYCIFSSTGKKMREELSFEKIISTLNDLWENKFNYIKFTGGEPFMRVDFIQVLKEAKKIGFDFDISTNASFIDDNISEELANLKMNFIHVSLDGYNEITHEKVRGKKTFNKTIKGLKSLIKFNSNIRIGCVIHKGNGNDLQNIVDFLEDLNINEVIFSIMSPIGKLKDNSILLNDLSIESLISQINNLKSKKIKISHNLNSNKNKCSDNKNQICPGGERFLFIDSIGIVSPCTWISDKHPKFHYLSLNKFPLNNILESELFKNFKEFKENNINKCVAFIKIEEKVSKFNKIYTFATENLNYLNIFNFKDKKSALTITGSGDQAIMLSSVGIKTITCIDVNYLSHYFAELKIISLKVLNFEEFIVFFTNNADSFNYKLYKKFKMLLSVEVEKFWNQIYIKNDYNGFKIRNSNLFNLTYDEINSNNIPYIKSEENYNKIKNEIRLTNFNFVTNDYMDYNDNKKYDLILLSNIADYSNKIFNKKRGDEHILSFKDLFVKKSMKHLNNNGVLMFAYLYDFLNENSSHIRNNINLQYMRIKYFSDLEYKEEIIKSAINNLKFDVICYIENKKYEKNK